MARDTRFSIRRQFRKDFHLLAFPIEAAIWPWLDRPVADTGKFRCRFSHLPRVEVMAVLASKNYAELVDIFLYPPLFGSGWTSVRAGRRIRAVNDNDGRWVTRRTTFALAS